VSILDAPPAAAMTYMSPLTGLPPSVYGGGGSASSRSLLEEPWLCLVSCGRAAFISATTAGYVEEDGGSGRCAGANAGRSVRAPFSVASSVWLLESGSGK